MVHENHCISISDAASNHRYEATGGPLLTGWDARIGQDSNYRRLRLRLRRDMAIRVMFMKYCQVYS